MKLTDHQSAAMHSLLAAMTTQPLVSLAGPAGSGKTTLIRELYGNFNPRDVAIVTPTNKAAKVLRDKGLPATTLYVPFFAPEKVKGKGLRFNACCDMAAVPEGKIDFIDTIILDEGSMLNSWPLSKLQQMCRRLILVGDPHQLPPVNDRQHPRGKFNALRHTAVLSEVLRQTDGSPILELAGAIRSGDKYGDLLSRFQPEDAFVNTMAQDYPPQLIAFTNKERARLNRGVRRINGHRGPLPQPGERLICASNYSDILLNGTEVTLRNLEWDEHSPLATAWLIVDGVEKAVAATISMPYFLNDQPRGTTDALSEMLVDWRFRELEDTALGDALEEALKPRFGYAITAHAAQGSEYDSVAVLDQRDVMRAVQVEGVQAIPTDEFIRRWVYTAITRARHELIVAPTWWAGNVTMAEAA